MLWRILCFTLFSVVCDGFQVSDTKLPNLNKLSPLHSFMDKLTNALSNAFENDKSLGDQINPGVSKKSDPIKMGRNVNLSFLINTSWNISLSFTGIPQKDPTSDLFASRPDSRVAVSNIYITFKEDNLLQLEHHEFLVQDVPGKWALDPDGITLALSLPAVGFERTVKTVGAITSIYGGNDTSQTSSTYFVPSGKNKYSFDSTVCVMYLSCY